jgi:hypothetical protein
MSTEGQPPEDPPTGSWPPPGSPPSQPPTHPPPGGWNPPPPPPPGYGQPPYGQPPGYGQAPPYGQPPAYGAPVPGYYAPQTEGMAIGALVSSILSWVFCPVIPAIVALILAANAKRKIDASGGALTGEGLVTAARIISWINIGLACLGLVIFIIAVAVGLATSEDTTLRSLTVTVGGTS